MPSIYAHYRFGAQALESFSDEVGQLLRRNRTLYDLGLQGPDFFYFYRFWTAAGAEVRDLARQYHYRTGAEVFTQFCKNLKRPSEGELAYLYGMLGHFCLDSACHPLIHALFPDDLTHNAMESEFDRYLMERSGVGMPFRYNRAKHLKSVSADAAVIGGFYPEATQEQTREGLKTMEIIQALLTLHRPAEGVLKLLGGSYPGLLMHRTPDMCCADRNDELMQLYRNAREDYPRMLHRLRSHMATREPLGKEFDRIFG